uniref:Ammonium transporter n=1 Tax=Chaetoceros debilis TaxID=122233 RepID=A0A7S3QFI0_9STRA
MDTISRHLDEDASATLERLDQSLVDLSKNIDVFYSLFCGAAIFMMQCGFAMLCAGSVRQKNVKNIMLKNLLDACGGALGYYAVGFGVAYEGGTFLGTSGGRFFLIDYDNYIDFFFQFTFAATAATIVAGTVAERCKMVAYLCYSLMLTGFVYPVVVHAIWNSAGFLSAFNESPFRGVGMIDFAGSGVVHMTGGATALIAAIVLGPRIGRFYDEDGNPLDKPGEFAPHSVSLQVLGTFILWFGWYGFNPGSTLFISVPGYGDVAALAAVTTTLAAAAGAVSSMFFDTLLGFLSEGEAEYDLTMAMNGCLGGLVGITAGCSTVEPWAAIIIGLIAGVVYVLASNLLVKLKIDDAVDAIPVHFFNGMWGCIATGLFASRRFVTMTYGETYSPGLFYGDGNLLLCEICGILFIIAWVTVIMGPFFIALNALGMFRVDPIEEKVGLDISHHKGAAYDLTGPAEGDVAELAEKRATAHGKSGFEDSA